MDRDYRRLTDFLVGMGVEQVPHTHKSYLAHLIAVYRSLESQGCPEDVCRAGMFHSIYGTEKFQGFTLPLERRDDVRALIGDRAEHLAYLNCAMDRASFDRALGWRRALSDHRPDHRRRGGALARDFDDLCRVHLFDWLEQVPRSREWDYRRAAYQSMAERLGRSARESISGSSPRRQPRPQFRGSRVENARRGDGSGGGLTPASSGTRTGRAVP